MTLTLERTSTIGSAGSKINSNYSPPILESTCWRFRASRIISIWCFAHGPMSSPLGMTPRWLSDGGRYRPSAQPQDAAQILSKPRLVDRGQGSCYKVVATQVSANMLLRFFERIEPSRRQHDRRTGLITLLATMTHHRNTCHTRKRSVSIVCPL